MIKFLSDKMSCHWISLNYACVACFECMWKRCGPSGLLMGGAVYATAFFRLSKQNKITVKGIQANAGMINTAAGCRDTNCSLVSMGLQWRRKKKSSEGGGGGGLSSFKGSKQNIPRKRGRKYAEVNRFWKKIAFASWKVRSGFSHTELLCHTHAHTLNLDTLASTAGSHWAASKKTNILPQMLNNDNSATVGVVPLKPGYWITTTT